jgi:transcriptional regulator with XRE-family HTH domain
MKKTIGQVIEAARKAHGLTQTELASSAGVKSSYIAQLEGGQGHPSLELLGRLGTVLKLGEEALFLAYPAACRLLQNKSRGGTDAWSRFTRNKTLLARHQVQPHELKVLAQINSLGSVIAAGDFLFILNSVRQAMAPDDGFDLDD